MEFKMDCFIKDFYLLEIARKQNVWSSDMTHSLLITNKGLSTPCKKKKKKKARTTHSWANAEASAEGKGKMGWSYCLATSWILALCWAPNMWLQSVLKGSLQQTNLHQRLSLYWCHTQALLFPYEGLWSGRHLCSRGARLLHWHSGSAPVSKGCKSVIKVVGRQTTLVLHTKRHHI